MDRRVIAKLYELDPEFRDVYDRLYGVSKNVDAADLHIDGAGGKKKDDPARQRRLAQTGLAATGVATAGGVHAIRATLAENRERTAALKTGAKQVGRAGRVLRLKPATAGKLAAAGWLGLHGVELTSDALAARAQTKAIRENPKPKQPVAKAFSLKPLNAADVRPKQPSLRARRRPGTQSIFGKGMVGNVRTATRNAAAASAHANQAAINAQQITTKVNNLVPKRRTLVLVGAGGLGATAGATYGATYAGSRRGTAAAIEANRPKEKNKPVAKSVIMRTEVAKVDTDQHLVFGWASVSTVDGVPILDLQGDVMPIDEVEKSAYRYVLTSRVGGDMHQRIAKADTTPKHTADLVESIVFTPDKIAAMGLPDSFRHAWWVGFHVNDEDTWQEIKSGKRTGFSVHGTGRREEILL